jgi:thiol-disulfide isomerase/thioredoxin
VNAPSGEVRFGRRVALGLVATGGALGAVALATRTSPAAVSRAAGETPLPALEIADLPVLSSGGAPSVGGGSGWLNSAGFSDADLADKVVLYDFWTFGCINCRHTLPHVKAWHERYATDGLVVLSIHTPEFRYEQDPSAVSDFLVEQGVHYPVVLDPHKVIWRRWENRYWPAFYLYDQNGALRLRHYGEGSYHEIEDAIRLLLEVDPEAPRIQLGD